MYELRLTARGKDGETEGEIDSGCFNLELSMDCGQVFGWHKRGGRYYGVVSGRPVCVYQEGTKTRFIAGRGLEPPRLARYLGLDDDLDAILRSIAVDRLMTRIVSRARGLRLLKQEPWPCLCSYILSANNRVDRIDRLVKDISRLAGVRHEIDGVEVYGLPGPTALVKCGEVGLRACGAGFRSPFLAEAARMVAEGAIDLASIGSEPYEEAKRVLMTIPGVGDKVADCVLLFALSKYEAFPVDVWIKRAVEKMYFDSKEIKPSQVRKFGRDHFGPYAGYAQEYIYYYARTCGIK